MIGIQLLRITNTSSTAVNDVPATGQAVFPEGQVRSIVLAGTTIRGSNAGGPAGSIPGPRAKIVSALVANSGVTNTYTASATLTIELGYLDNDGYFSVFLTS